VENNNGETRQERRERKLQKKKEQQEKHGKSLALIYRNAIFKRFRKEK